jgi:hypothetical protein
MPDIRVRVPLNGKTINLAQLAAEVDADLSASDVEVVVADPVSTVTAAALRSAVEAHIPAPELDPDADLAAAIDAVDTSKVTDSATKAALNALKSALVGSGKPVAVSGRPTDR